MISRGLKLGHAFDIGRYKNWVREEWSSILLRHLLQNDIMSNRLNSMTGEMIEELRQYGDVAQGMVSRCDDPLQILQLIVETIRVAVRHGDCCLFAEYLIVYQT